MIPKICANCATGRNIADEAGQISMTICLYLPIAVAQYPNHACGQFSMSDAPSVTIEEPEEQEEEPDE